MTAGAHQAPGSVARSPPCAAEWPDRSQDRRRVSNAFPPRVGSMPVEGHWERANTPLRRRDRQVIRVALVIGVLAVVGLGIAYALRPAARSNAGCVVASVPSTMGGATLR